MTELSPERAPDPEEADPNADRRNSIRPRRRENTIPYEKAPHESGMYIHWYGQNMWLFAPVQNQIKRFLSTIEPYPFQQGSSLNAAGINYQTLKAAALMKRLQEIESLPSPGN